MENKYYNIALGFKKKLEETISIIFKTYGNELLLRIEELNILQNKHNSIETSTAIGYLLEEFIISKLEIFISASKNFEFDVTRNKQSTQNSSFDFTSMYKNNYFLINLKAEKNANNAVAAINKLYNDYVKDNIEKHFLILKINYLIDFSKLETKKLNKKIIIKKIESYFLEEIDFSRGHTQDNRNWSEKFNPNSGRLIISTKFISENKLPINKISYKNTCIQLENIFESNLKKEEN